MEHAGSNRVELSLWNMLVVIEWSYLYGTCDSHCGSDSIILASKVKMRLKFQTI